MLCHKSQAYTAYLSFEIHVAQQSGLLLIMQLSLHNIVQSLVVLTSNLDPIVNQIISEGPGMP